MNRLRTPTSVVCTIVCVAGILAGAISTYASRVLFDAEVFSDRVSSSLAERHVAGVVADQITDQVLALRRDLTAYRPVLRGVVEQVISSAPFRAIVRLAARKIHPILISNGESLSLTLADLGVVVHEALSLYPQLAGKVPERAQFMVGPGGSWPAGKTLLRILRAGHRLQRRRLLWPALGLMAGVLGLLLAHRKDRYLLGLGLGLTVAAFLLAALARFGGGIAADLIRSPTASDLVRGLWPAFLGPLGLWMLGLAALGMVLTAAVTTVLEKLDVAALARFAWRAARRRPDRSGWSIVRGLVLVLVAVAVVLHPSEALEVATIAGAALIFFIGIQDLFSIVTRFAARTRASFATREERKRRSLWPVVAAASILAIVVGGGVLWLAQRPEATATGPAPITACNGSALLCDQRLDQVVFPTTHNSMSAADIQNWMFPEQERSIREQLEDGVRGLLIDVHYGEPVKGRIKTLIEHEVKSVASYDAALGKQGFDAAMRIRDRLVGKPEGERAVYLAHGFCELGATPFVEALKSIREFLVLNPNEVLVIIVQDEGVTPADVAACFKQSGLEDFVYRGAVTPPWPTLAEMISRGERVLVMAENHAEGVPWYHLMTDVVQETPYAFKDASEFSNVPNRGGTKGSLLLMNHWIESPPAPLPSNAQIVNAYDFLLKRARSCARQRHMIPNLVAVDFYRTGDLFKVVRTLNGIPEPAGPPAP